MFIGPLHFSSGVSAVYGLYTALQSIDSCVQAVCTPQIILQDVRDSFVILNVSGSRKILRALFAFCTEEETWFRAVSEWSVSLRAERRLIAGP